MLAPACVFGRCTQHSCEIEGWQLFLGLSVGNLLKSSGQAIAAFLRVAACILGVAMLMSFPARRSHQFGEHFGTAQIRQNILRHTFVAGPEDGAVEDVAQIEAQPAIPTPANIEHVAKSFIRVSTVPQIPTFRILRHLRLGASRSGSSDPLL